MSLIGDTKTIYFVQRAEYDDNNYEVLHNADPGVFYADRVRAQVEVDKFIASEQRRYDLAEAKRKEEHEYRDRKHEALVAAGLEKPRARAEYRPWGFRSEYSLGEADLVLEQG